MPRKQPTKPAPDKAPATAKRKRQTRQPRYAEAAVLRGRILELRVLGRTIAQISDEVKRAPSVVHAHLQNALDELNEEHKEKTERFRALSIARLEKLLAKAILLGASGNLKAMHQAQRLIMAQARLMGTEAPIKHATTDPTGEHERAAPGTWTLPMRQDVPIQDWQAQAERVWQEQQARDHAEQA